MEKMKDELTGVKTIKSDSSEGFFTESSESSQAESEKETKKEKDERNFEDILLMNEAQITQMLVQAVQSKGEAINPLISDKLQMKRAPVDMTEKQRLTCQLIV